MQKRQNLITVLLLVAICVLGFITYQQQNYIESLNQSIQESNTPSKKLFRRIQDAEGSIDANQVALDDLERRVSDLESEIDNLDDSAQSVDYLTNVTTYDLEKRINMVESDLYYLRSQLNRY